MPLFYVLPSVDVFDGQNTFTNFGIRTLARLILLLLLLLECPFDYLFFLLRDESLWLTAVGDLQLNSGVVSYAPPNSGARHSEVLHKKQMYCSSTCISEHLQILVSPRQVFGAEARWEGNDDDPITDLGITASNLPGRIACTQLGHFMMWCPCCRVCFLNNHENACSRSV